MTRTRTATTLLVVTLLVVGVATPVLATNLPTGTDAGHASASMASTTASTANDTTNGSVNVSVGPQLATVISVTSDDVETDIEDSAFELEYEGANESAKAETIAERAETLQERAESIREDYREATKAYNEGELTKDQYAQRLATLNARATNVLESADKLRRAAENVSALELRAAGLSTQELSGLAENLSTVTGAGPTALLHRFTGETEGEIELGTADGLKIEVENEDGEVSRELSRDRDDDNTISVDQSTALTTARGALSTPDNGTWTLEKASIHPDSGYYKFEFVLTGASNATGEAEVRVDGSTGDVFRVEEEIEPRDDEGDDEREDADEQEDADDEREDVDDDESENESDDADERELALLVTSGTPGPGESITVQARSNGEPASGIEIELNGRTIGTTDANGTVDLTLPTSGEVEIRTASGDDDGELEFDLGEAEDAVSRDIATSVSATDGTVTVTVTYQGSAVSGATVEANGDVVGTTDSTGTVTFPTPTDDELEIEITKGEFETEVTYTVQNGEFVETDDDAERDDTDEDSDADDSDADDDDSDDSDDTDDTEDDSSDTGDDSDDSTDSDDGDDDSSGSDDS